MSYPVWMFGAGEWAESWVGLLGRASGQGALFILVVWLGCRFLPRMPPAWRCGLWWLACLRLLVGLLDPSPLRLAVLPPQRTPLPLTAPVESPAEPAWSAPASVPSSAVPVMGLSPALAPLGLWVAGVLIRFGLVARTFFGVWRLRHAARPVMAWDVLEETARLAEQAGLRRIPLVLCSPGPSGPMLIGPWAPALLLPADLVEGCSASELRMALAHEMAHLRRGDLWLALVPGVVQVLFFFHPLAWLAVREWAIAREAACDAETLRLTSATPAEYGRFLLRLAQGDPTPIGALGVTPTYRTLERRLRMLRDSAPLHPGRVRSAGALLILLLCVGLLPWQVTAQDAIPSVATTPVLDVAATHSGLTLERIRALCQQAQSFEARERARFDFQLHTLSDEWNANFHALVRDRPEEALGEPKRLAAELEERAQYESAQALAAFEQQLLRGLRRLEGQGADPWTIRKLGHQGLQIARERTAQTLELERRAREERLRHLGQNGRAVYNRATGELRLPHGGVTIIGHQSGSLPAAAPAPAPASAKSQVISTLSIRGNTAFPLAEVRQVLKTRVGEAFDASRWTEDQAALSRLYQERGYQVRLKSSGPEKGKLALVIDEVRVGDVRLKWLQPEDGKHADIVKGHLQQKKGALYSSRQLQEDYRALQELNLFETINPQVEVGGDGKVVIVWELKQK